MSGCPPRAWLAAVAYFLAMGCGGSVPQTRYYQLTEAVAKAAQPGGQVLVVEPLRADAAYDDDRIVYRSGEFRLDYFHYHRWSATTGPLVADFLRRGYEAQGLFRAVTDAIGEEGGVVLSGRVVALERVDSPDQPHRARVALTLRLRDSLGKLLWSETFRRERELREPTISGLAEAMSGLLSELVAETGGKLAQLARQTAPGG